MVKFLRVLSREPLRSASRHLEFSIGFLNWGPGNWLSTGLLRVPRRLRDPINRRFPFGLLAPSAFLAIVCLYGLTTYSFIRTARPFSEVWPWWCQRVCGARS